MRKTPYQLILEEAKCFCREVKFRRTVLMWRYPKNDLGKNWNIASLYERVAAAGQLGYEVVLSADNNGLGVEYRKKVPETPWRFS